MDKDAIGGYFGLEESGHRSIFHDGAIPLNTGRNALELIIKLRGYKKGYIPYYTCDAIVSVFARLGVKYEFYGINGCFEPLLDPANIGQGEFLLYTNYFGLMEGVLEQVSKKYVRLVVDNSQAFYSKPRQGVDSFYSLRKFFGVPDGAFAYVWGEECPELPVDDSSGRIEHLVRRLEGGAEAGYAAYLENENCLGRLPVMQMSKLTHTIAANLDYCLVAARRRKNFDLMESLLRKCNGMLLPRGGGGGPMAYPFYSSCSGLREHLLSSRIFVPRYWENVLQWCTSPHCIEVDFTKHLLALPIDQRMSDEDVVYVAHTILDYLKRNEN